MLLEPEGILLDKPWACGFEPIVRHVYTSDTRSAGRNALQTASWGGHQEIVKLLLDNGAEVNAQGGDYGNALQAASRGGHREIVKLLQRRGAITLSLKRSGSGTPSISVKKPRLMDFDFCG